MPTNPIDAEKYRQIEALLQEALKTRDYLSKCRACNIDVETEIKDNADHIAVLSKILELFKPDAQS